MWTTTILVWWKKLENISNFYHLKVQKDSLKYLPHVLYYSMCKEREENIFSMCVSPWKISYFSVAWTPTFMLRVDRHWKCPLKIHHLLAFFDVFSTQGHWKLRMKRGMNRKKRLDAPSKQEARERYETARRESGGDKKDSTTGTEVTLMYNLVSTESYKYLTIY